ncbi:hypothetical protein [Paracoccus sp. DMF]|uniref:hypothetical protein n=1 Tax=Paracoccus sp. DMF TaxID=400837 RepID=UPI001103498B|nr:hypothetical protein [Paracoccus sp. DMF]MCV2448457.1 hypothetical protein [Paracoccus sp. DMF]
MRIFLAVFALVASVGVAHSEGAPKGEITSESIDVCEKWGRFAELAMTAHQDGRPLADQMKLSPDPRAYELTLEAYRAERFISDSQKERAAAHYRDRIVAECLSSLSGMDESGGKRPASFWAIEKQ